MKLKRLLSLLLCVCMVLALLPATTITASAAGTGAIQLGAGGISGGGTNWVYYGEYDATDDSVDNPTPVMWRVLAATGGNCGTYQDSSGIAIDSAAAMFLLSEYILADHVDFDISGLSNEWLGSDAQSWCISLYSNNFNTAEKAAIAAMTKMDAVYYSDSGCSFGNSVLSGEHVFFLSAEEADNSSYGFSSDNDRIAYMLSSASTAYLWWLRSPFASSTNCAGFVDDTGNIKADVFDDGLNDDGNPSDGDLNSAEGVRPAFNLNLSSVLFASAAAGGKSAIGMDSGLTAVTTTTPTAWKLTLLDSGRSFAASTAAVDSTANTVTIVYSGAATGTNEYISAVIIDSSGNIKYYGRIAQPTAASGTATIDISNLGSGDTLKVFFEQYNGDYETDYASALQTVINPVMYSLSNMTTTGVTYAADATDYTATLSADAGYLLPLGVSVAVGGISATLANSAADADTAGEYYYDASTGAVKVAAVNGAVVITAAGVAKTYTISTSPAGLNFGSSVEGYTTLPAAQTVTVTNNGNSAVAGYTVTGGGTDFNMTYTPAAIAASGTSTFTVQPVTGLAAGSHTATLTITTNESTTATVSLSFTVTADSSSDGDTYTTYFTITTAAGTGGSISPGGSTSVAYGNDKTYAIVADDGYEIEDVLVDGVSVGAVSNYTFKNVKKAHTISASFKETEEDAVNPFTDVTADNWFYENVMYVYENGLMTGTGGGAFAPNSTLTRGMFVTILYRMSEDSGTYTNPFGDVPSGEYYENAATWAYENGITGGVGTGLFGPGIAITREQLAVMLYNYAKYMGYDVSVGEDTNILSDNDALTISDYAYAALQWACGAGIIQGDSNGNLNPGASASRAEVAAIMQRFIENVTV